MEPILCDLVIVEIDGIMVPAIVTEIGLENEDGSWTVAVSTFHTPKHDARNLENVALYPDRETAAIAAEDAGKSASPHLAYLRD